MAEKTYNIHTRVNLIADDLQKTARLLEKGQQASLTKSELKGIINKAIFHVLSAGESLMKYHNALVPVEAGDKNNSLFDELQKIIEDIGTVQFMIAQGKIMAADKLLANVKNRV